MKFLLFSLLALNISSAFSMVITEIPVSFTSDEKVDGSWLKDNSYSDGSSSIVEEHARKPASVEMEKQEEVVQKEIHVTDLTGTFEP